MALNFARGSDTVVAAVAAGGSDLSVVDMGRREGDRCVTIFAGIARCNMWFGCISFCQGIFDRAVMAGHARRGRHNSVVVAEYHGTAGPTRCGVAEGTVGRTLHMAR